MIRSSLVVDKSNKTNNSSAMLYHKYSCIWCTWNYFSPARSIAMSIFRASPDVIAEASHLAWTSLWVLRSQNVVIFDPQTQIVWRRISSTDVVMSLTCNCVRNTASSKGLQYKPITFHCWLPPHGPQLIALLRAFMTQCGYTKALKQRKRHNLRAG